ncbi:TREHALOSE 6-PHOSPHATE PHOSPHATASE [Salix viminalis]|uniref:TREHALOSE 6-PHOSPHATE PHOSPHATASE n=1 Tax=Salix viminalis TaxID=40686 RepID=A0A9Q0YYI1_SALVM|nr:TREHALOSE 6-PHOSPHATE PHOSPHATASE [Salix viminalis]
MDIGSNHSSPVLADPAPINKARLGIHSNLLTYAPSGGSLSSSKYRNIPRKKPGKLDEVCSNACLDAMKSSSPPRKKLIKDGSDTTYSTWMVYQLVGLTELYYAGSHGMDILGPVRKTVSNDHPNCTETTTDQQGKEVNLFQPAREFIPMIDEVFRTLNWQSIAQCVQDVVEEYPRLRKTHGRKVLEVRPMIDWNKGKAVEFLLESLGEIAYSKHPRPKETNAVYSLKDPSEVSNFYHLSSNNSPSLSRTVSLFFSCQILRWKLDNTSGDEISQLPGDMEEGGCILNDTGGPSDDLQT